MVRVLHPIGAMANRQSPARQRLRTLKICLSVLCLGCLAIAVILVARPSLARVNQDSVARVAEPLLVAARQWREQNPEGCPTLGGLIHEGVLSAEVEREDPWGGTFRLVCNDNGAFTLVSPGKDGRLGTEDDIEWPAR